MNKNEHRQQLFEHMREVMANDRARHNILPLSKFGLMQITRQRVRPALDIVTTETCPSCFGKGEVQPSLLFTDTLFEKIEYVVNELGKTGFNVYVHPFVEAYLKKGWLMSLASRWRRQLGGKFKIYADQSLAYLQYRVVDSEGNILDLKQEKDTDSSSAEKTNNKVAKRSEADNKEQQADKPQTEAKQQKQPKANKNKATKANKASNTPTAEQTDTAVEAAGDENTQPQKQTQKSRKQRKQRPQKSAKPAEANADAQPSEVISLDTTDYTKALPAHQEAASLPVAESDPKNSEPAPEQSDRQA
jgi:ribonuclease G